MQRHHHYFFLFASLLILFVLGRVCCNTCFPNYYCSQCFHPGRIATFFGAVYGHSYTYNIMALAANSMYTISMLVALLLFPFHPILQLKFSLPFDRLPYDRRACIHSQKIDSCLFFIVLIACYALSIPLLCVIGCFQPSFTCPNNCECTHCLPIIRRQYTQKTKKLHQKKIRYF